MPRPDRPDPRSQLKYALAWHDSYAVAPADYVGQSGMLAIAIAKGDGRALPGTAGDSVKPYFFS